MTTEEEISPPPKERTADGLTFGGHQFRAMTRRSSRAMGDRTLGYRARPTSLRRVAEPFRAAVTQPGAQTMTSPLAGSERSRATTCRRCRRRVVGVRSPLRAPGAVFGSIAAFVLNCRTKLTANYNLGNGRNYDIIHPASVARSVEGTANGERASSQMCIPQYSHKCRRGFRVIVKGCMKP